MKIKEPYIVAELGSVHDGSFGNAMKLIQLAADVGANVAKFQLHIAHAETTLDAPSPSFFSEESRYKYFERIAFTVEQWTQLYQMAKSKNLQFGCSVFSSESLNQLLNTGVDIVKIPSGEVTNISLLKEVAHTCNRVHISTGMSNFKEIDVAVEILSQVEELVLFQCRSQYPVPADKIGLNVIKEFTQRYGIPIGFSDHSTGVEMSIAAIALGAIAVEKHLTFSRNMYGSDASNALEPNEFSILATGARNVWTALQHSIIKDDISELMEVRKVFQKSIAVKTSLDLGHVIAESDLIFLKPETGIPASEINTVIGRRLSRPLPAGSIIEIGDLQ
jgi:N-acetylneuraminate synthase